MLGFVSRSRNQELLAEYLSPIRSFDLTYLTHMIHFLEAKELSVQVLLVEQEAMNEQYRHKLSVLQRDMVGSAHPGDHESQSWGFEDTLQIG